MQLKEIRSIWTAHYKYLGLTHCTNAPTYALRTGHQCMQVSHNLHHTHGTRNTQSKVLLQFRRKAVCVFPATKSFSKMLHSCA